MKRHWLSGQSRYRSSSTATTMVESMKGAANAEPSNSTEVSHSSSKSIEGFSFMSSVLPPAGVSVIVLKTSPALAKSGT